MVIRGLTVIGCAAAALVVAWWVATGHPPLPAAAVGRAVLHADGHADATPSLASSGRFVAVAWGATFTGRTDVYVAVSTDGGVSFATPVRVNDIPGTARLGGELPPRVSIAAREEGGSVIDVLWTATEAGTVVRLSRSEDGGRTFHPSRELQAAAAAGDRGWAALALDADGHAHAVWLDHRGMASERAVDETHDHHGHATAPLDSRAAFDGVAMAQKSSLYYGDIHGEREVVKGVCYCCKTALAITPDGRLLVAWRHVYPRNIRDIAFAMSVDRGRTFSDPLRVSEDDWQLNGCPDDGPAMAVDARGVAHLAWPTLVPSPEPHKAVFYASSADGRTFSPRLRVSAPARHASHPHIAVSADGDVVVLWDEVADGRRRVFASWLQGGAYTPPDALSEDTSAMYAAATFVDRALLVVWTEASGDQSRVVVTRFEGR
jgi:hypothetical protein